MKNAPLFSLKWKDIAKGIITAILTVIIAGLGTSLSNGHFPTLNELGTLALTGLAAGLAYLGKNVLTNSDDQFLTKEDQTKMPK